MQSFKEFAKNKKKKKVVLIIGSARNSDCCPAEKSKTHKIADYLTNKFEENTSFEIIDLSVKCDGVNVQPCKGCVSTSAFHCHWYCDCYSKDSNDLMHKQNVYKKLEECDGFFVLTPINWSSCSSVVKSFFDRLVCANLTMTSEKAIELLGKDNIKNNKKTRELEKSGKYNDVLVNHLEGKFAGFFAHGNDGGSDYKEFAKNTNNLLPVLPESIVKYEKTHGKEDISKLLDPLVRQCVYSGIHVPDDCVKILTYGFGINYSEVNDLFNKEMFLKNEAEKVFNIFLNHLD
jgi:multimeric flavodoxin WrbA